MSPLVQRLVRSLETLLSARCGDTRPLLVTRYNARDVIYRPVATVAGRTPPASDDSVLFDNCRWEPVTSVSRLLGPLQMQLRTMVQWDEWSHVLFLFSAAAACVFLARVAGAVGATLRFDVDLNRLTSRSFRTQCALARKRASVVRRSVEKAMSAMTNCLTLPHDAASQARLLKLQFDNGQPCVIWMTETGTTVSRESLSELVDRVARTYVQGFLDRSSSWSARLESCRSYIEQSLQEACPRLAQSILEASRGRKLGIWLFSGLAQGSPAEGMLYLDSPRADFQGQATVACNRAHAEFILQNADRSYFWFPPCMLSARIHFGQAIPLPLLCRPEVRIPRGSPPMVHPYAGDMLPDTFASFDILNPRDYTPAMIPVSSDLSKLAIPLRASTAYPVMRDLCIPAQDARIRTILIEAKYESREMQPYCLVEGIWRLAVQGLTRAHEDNQNLPRARLDSSSMYYPVGNPQGIAGTAMEARVFRYRA